MKQMLMYVSSISRYQPNSQAPIELVKNYPFPTIKNNLIFCFYIISGFISNRRTRRTRAPTLVVPEPPQGLARGSGGLGVVEEGRVHPHHHATVPCLQPHLHGRVGYYRPPIPARLDLVNSVFGCFFTLV